ncbi:Uncharacterised protein [Vibrio cholerae]|nr:Uncharacterised protein [Vibrio cholerae]
MYKKIPIGEVSKTAKVSWPLLRFSLRLAIC